MPSPLSSKAVLVSLNISFWSARRLDRKITDETNQAHNAVADAGRYNKLLLKKEALEKMAAPVTAARIAHINMTQPWTDTGPRLLPSKLVMEYQKRMRTYRQDFEQAVEEFSQNYPRYVEERRKELNGMFRAADYPSPREISRKFYFGIEMFNVPDVGDFRVSIGKEYEADLRAQIEASTQKALGTAMRDTAERIVEAVSRMSERLHKYKPGVDGERPEGVFRDSMVENVRALADLLPAFNLTDDQVLAKITNRIKTELCEFDAKQLRDSDNARIKVAASADSILQSVSEFMA